MGYVIILDKCIILDECIIDLTWLILEMGNSHCVSRSKIGYWVMGDSLKLDTKDVCDWQQFYDGEDLGISLKLGPKVWRGNQKWKSYKWFQKIIHSK